MVFIILMAVLPQNNVEAVGEPDVTLKFRDDDVQTADVRPGEHGAVVFPGIVEADMVVGDSVQDIIVRFTGSTDKGWPVEFNPPAVQMDPGGNAAFSVLVSVPSETSCEEEGRLTIGGVASTFPGAAQSDVPPIYGTIIIAQFFKYLLTTEHESYKGSLEDEIAVNLLVSNIGNGQDKYEISIYNLDDLKSKGFSFKPSSHQLTLNEKTNGSVKITMILPSDKKYVGTHEIEVDVRSITQKDEEGAAFTKTWCFEVEVENKGFEIATSNNIILISLIIIIAVIISIIYRRKRNKKLL
ncbi:MAG: hypothetical protein JSV49_08650 [Thermoplasmata archaeon]|nr:MAG: hypothetical protein JSV49_08650 [Thermoplasmata archaeon]